MLDLSEKYKIIKPLGSQIKRKFGEVFLVENKQTGELGVLKSIKRLSNNQHLQDRLLHESTFSFDSKGLPKTLDLNVTDNEINLVKNYLPGISLDHFWATVPRRKKKEVLLKIVTEFRPLLNSLSQLKIVHCDIKPSNILIDSQEGNLAVSLIDFGMALKQNETNQRSTLFPLGYAAPELLLNKLDLIDNRTDLYSLGIVIWKLFVGKLPLTHPNPSIFTNLQLTHPLPDSNELPKNLYPILKKMCNKHQFNTAPNLIANSEVEQSLREAMNQRYPSIDAFIEDFSEVLLRKNWFGF